MQDLVITLIGAVWLFILFAMAVAAFVRLPRREAAAPFLDVLRRRGYSVTQAEEVAGFAGVARAAERCSSCELRRACRRSLRWGWLGFAAPACPNAAFFARIAGKRGI